MSTCLDLRFDVSAALALPGRREMAASIHLPEPSRLSSPPIVVFAVPGGGYSRGYFDMHFEGHAGYSEAAFHTARGLVFVAFDHLGVGDSTLDGIEDLTIDHLADAYALAVNSVCDRIRTGALTSGFPGISAFTKVGIGQSMGGCITIVTQGKHHVFDGIGVLGYSAIHTQLPQPSEEARIEAMSAHNVPRDADFHGIDREAIFAKVSSFIYPFHWEDVPKEILEADMKGGYPLRKTSPPFGSLTLPPCAAPMMSAGVVAGEAAAIKAPVLVAVGERDVCPDPHAEPGAYRNSRDVSLYIEPRMAHMHNFASSRETFWENTFRWASRVARLRTMGNGPGSGS
jgi:pimeloyl-ACP methyl ester carboxylesterase